MIVLNTPSRQLELDLGSASTSPLKIVVAFRDERADQADAYGSQLSSSNGTSDVIICTAPPSGMIRKIESISVTNPTGNDTETVRIYYDEGGTEYDIFKVNLAAGEMLFYEDE